MNATTVVGKTTLMKEIVDRIDAIIQMGMECGELSEPQIIGDSGFRTFVAALRCVSLDVVKGKATNVKFTLPTIASGFWMASVDPFLFAEALREIDVELQLAVFDDDNQNALRINMFVKPAAMAN